MTDPFVAASGSGLPILILLLAVFVFLFVLPNRRRQRAQKNLLRNVDVGDEILTVGGLIGRVVETHDSELLVEIADGVTVRIARRGVATVLHPEEEDEEPEEAEDDEELVDEPDEEPAEGEPRQDPR